LEVAESEKTLGDSVGVSVTETPCDRRDTSSFPITHSETLSPGAPLCASFLPSGPPYPPSAAMALVSVHVSWPYPATTVVCVGTFCEWKASKGVHLVNNGGSHVGTLHVPELTKVSYKFIVDGHWSHDEHAPHETDAAGNTNNVSHAPSATELSHRMSAKVPHTKHAVSPPSPPPAAVVRQAPAPLPDTPPAAAAGSSGSAFAAGSTVAAGSAASAAAAPPSSSTDDTAGQGQQHPPSPTGKDHQQPAEALVGAQAAVVQVEVEVQQTQVQEQVQQQSPTASTLPSLPPSLPPSPSTVYSDTPSFKSDPEVSPPPSLTSNSDASTDLSIRIPAASTSTAAAAAQKKATDAPAPAPGGCCCCTVS
jgi:hypothetical protein